MAGNMSKPFYIPFGTFADKWVYLITALDVTTEGISFVLAAKGKYIAKGLLVKSFNVFYISQNNLLWQL
jgi:hypothetical protein